MEGNQGMKDQSASNGVSSATKLRYPLRSAARSKEGKQAMAADPSGSSATRRLRPSADVSKSVSVLDLSGKDKTAKVPGRLSFPPKYSPRPTPSGSITPISEARTRRSNTLGKSDTPVSDVSRSSSRRKFSVLSSVSYWLTQIKLSESAGKHSISLGFFKLALEAGCEPIQRLREEFKSYACRYNLVAELGEPVKDLLQSYNISEDLEKLNISGDSSQLPENGSHSSDEDLHSSSTTRTGNLKPKLVNSDALAVRQSNKMDTAPKKLPTPRTKSSSLNKTSKTTTSTENKKSQTQKKPESNAEKGKIKNSMKSTPTPAEKVDSIVPSPAHDASQEEKENMDIQQEIQTN